MSRGDFYKAEANLKLAGSKPNLVIVEKPDTAPFLGAGFTRNASQTGVFASTFLDVTGPLGAPYRRQFNTDSLDRSSS